MILRCQMNLARGTQWALDADRVLPWPIWGSMSIIKSYMIKSYII
jgi:hypothetical protein